MDLLPRAGALHKPPRPLPRTDTTAAMDMDRRDHTRTLLRVDTSSTTRLTITRTHLHRSGTNTRHHLLLGVLRHETGTDHHRDTTAGGATKARDAPARELRHDDNAAARGAIAQTSDGLD